MAKDNEIELKSELAAVVFIVANVASLGDIPVENIFSAISRGVAGDDLDTEELSNPLPNIICEAGDTWTAEDAGQFTGNWQGALRIIVSSSADDNTRAEHLARVSNVFNVFLTAASLAHDLENSLADYACNMALIRTKTVASKGRLWVSTLTLELSCCGSDLE